MIQWKMWKNVEYHKTEIQDYECQKEIDIPLHKDEITKYCV